MQRVKIWDIGPHWPEDKRELLGYGRLHCFQTSSRQRGDLSESYPSAVVEMESTGEVMVYPAEQVQIIRSKWFNWKWKG